MKNITVGIAVVLALLVVGGAFYWYADTAQAPTQTGQEAGIANPASVNCTQTLGGQLQVVDTPQGQVGFCHLPDGHLCDEWVLFRGEYCTTFYIGTTQHFMLLDQGTAPPPRKLLVYDLSLGTTTYTDQYNQPTALGDGTFTYWQPTATKPTAANCPDLSVWRSQDLGAGLERHVSLNLATLSITDLGEQRCSARQ